MFENNFFFRIGEGNFNQNRQLIIAELGTSCNADLVKAKEMADAACQSGADCIKFQMVYADEILHPNTGEVALPGGKIRLFDRFKALEVPVDFYFEMKEYVESKGLIFLCTPFGLKSASALKGIGQKVIKIASPELNYTSLLEEISGYNLPVLLSSGVSLLSDIEKALEILRHGTDSKNEGKICLLHCVTSYPAPETDYNLRVLLNLAAIFGVATGISDHSSDPELVPALAASMGACVIEKHFCLSKTDSGLDDPIALDPEEFSQMTKGIRYAVEVGVEKTIAVYKKKHSEELIEKILGSGIKTLAPSERENYTRTNRSIHAVRDIAQGETIKKSDYAVLRTEKNLRPGLEPCWEERIEGRIARNFIPAGEGILFEDI
jgi:sialic acid synthase SpsE